MLNEQVVMSLWTFVIANRLCRVGSGNSSSNVNKNNRLSAESRVPKPPEMWKPETWNQPITRNPTHAVGLKHVCKSGANSPDRMSEPDKRPKEMLYLRSLLIRQASTAYIVNVFAHFLHDLFSCFIAIIIVIVKVITAAVVILLFIYRWPYCFNL